MTACVTTRPPFYVITGGPGSGKSTLIKALAAKDYRTVSETGRAVIKDEAAKGGTALPWADKVAFRDEMMRRDVAQYAEATRDGGPVFFDRGIPDSLGYSRLEGLPESAELREAIETHPYAARVFITPPWQEIYENDAERKQDFAEAVRTCEMLRKVYAELGYEVVEVPKAAVEDRVQFVTERARL